MTRVGILAYGSPIEDPGIEIEPFVSKRICNVETPFNIEFARTSSSRNGAPALVPVTEGGMPAKGTITELAFRSAKEEAGKNGRDGISYLISVKRQNINTPLMAEYEN